MEDLKDDVMGRSPTSGGGLDSQREELIQFWAILLLSVEGRMFLSTVLWKLDFSKNNYINPFIEKGGIPWPPRHLKHFCSFCMKLIKGWFSYTKSQIKMLILFKCSKKVQSVKLKDG